MNAPTRSFEAKPATRESTPLLVGLMGCSGSGKTFSALRLATGIQQVTGGDIFGIDTEARRMLHYAEQFKFRHVQFDAPFGSLDYLSAIRYCVDQGARVIVIDSMSHEHEGPGGLLDYHEQELERLAGSDWQKRERVKMLAWQRPKAARRRLINGLLQLNANFVFCFRAKQTAKPMKVGGRTEVVPLGFMPIAGDEMVFEMTLNCLLLPAAKGVPTWQSENMGERQMIKPAHQFDHLFTEPRPLDENIGRELARWAQGGAAPAASPAGASAPDPVPPTEAPANPKWKEVEGYLEGAARQGTPALKTAWENLLPGEREHFKPALDRRFKPMAAEADLKMGSMENGTEQV